ncbi:Glycerophosphocholine phosphodiesterase [Pichia californica]|uniref:Glycerophosphocholine phosphodiesterase n=1 Tax=Pichia californica TaxID=460514 RepID=A0A9P7BGL1_9ASCO|nr:Glycerophosphocholine phosphodiesterase [[Candida] californica]KAG0689345.1 Glycerophosphocholine phosphodiesterase [[Candida] californica]
MKFGHTLLSHQVPEWQQNYIDYKLLKKIVKSINARESELRFHDKDVDVFSDSEIKVDLARFFFHIDSDAEKVDEFYTKKYLDYERRLKKLIVVFPKNSKDIDDLDEYDDLVDILLELRNCFRNLKWYAELNRRGFVKILKKLDKKTGTKKQESYLQKKIFPLSFCNDSDTVKMLSSINDLLNKLSNVKDQYDFPNNNNKSNENSAASSISNLDINPLNNDNFATTSDQVYLQPPSTFITQSINPTKVSTSDPFWHAIKDDNVDLLDSLLTKEYMSPVLAPLKLLLSLLNKSTLELSYKCIDLLLKIIPVLSDSGDVTGRNFIHHHVVALGKKNYHRSGNNYNIGQVGNKTDYNSSLFNTYGPDGINSSDSSQGLYYIFQNLPAHLKFAILQKDNYKRTPLHYASQYGLKQVTYIILQFLKEWGMFNESVSLDDIAHWGDSENLTPIHLSILGKHPKTTEVLIDSIDKNIDLTCPYLLHVATRMNTPGLLQCLLKCKGIEINAYESVQSKETALYISAKYNLKDSVKTLLENGANSEIGESSFGWTPVFVAAANGFEDIIDLLIENGCKYFIQDESGWTPREHAALRGHINIIFKLTPLNFNPYDSLNMSSNISPNLSPNLMSVNSSNSSSILKIADVRAKTPEASDKIDLKQLKQNNSSFSHLPISNKTIIGNRYLKRGESLVLITMGTTDLRDNTPALELKKLPLSKIHSSELDSALSIVIRSPNVAESSEYPLALPLDDNHGSSTDPITFKCVNQNPLDTIIYFDIIPTFEVDVNDVNTEKKILGRGVAILRDIYTPVGTNKRSLFNCVKIPILEMGTMEVLGNIKFEFLFVKSFEERGRIPENADRYWKSLTQPRLIGHRGNGMNSRNKKSLQLGENTVESFIAAASLGAQYVEFDVQLTKDDVPVIYHDFIVAESGIDIPMHSLTLEQFMHLSLGNKKDKSDMKKKVVKDDMFIPRKTRSRSFTKGNILGNKTSLPASIDFYESDDEDTNPNQERMKLTKTWKQKEFKANTRGSSIASSFTTLEELFKKVPKSAGFNIELKYPMLDESQMDDIGQIAPEMNHFLDTILALVYNKYEGRNVIFSSFHPDICMMMTMKQPTFPVLLLTEAGVSPMADVRASSLQNAIRFAKNWNLFGIVSDAVPFVYCPRLAGVVKASGLACFTYGSANNDPANAKLEIAAGVDAVIVDSVLAVRKELTKFDEIIKPKQQQQQKL